MSKKLPKTAKPLNYKPKNSLPKLQGIKTEWDLEKLYYKSAKDPQIELDLRKTEESYESFAKKYKNAAFSTSSVVLLRALTDLEKISAQASGSKPLRYFGFRTVLNAKDVEAEKAEQKIEQRLTKAGNKILFFQLQLSKIPKKQQKIFLETPELQHYKYYLQRVFLTAKHNLSEPEEKILNLLASPSYGLWANMTEKILANKMVIFKGKNIPLTTVISSLDSYSKKDKIIAWKLIVETLAPIGEIAENELTAVCTTKKVRDELRNFSTPFESTVLSYEDDTRSITALIDAVSGKGFQLSREFYKTKAKISNVTKIPYVLKYESLGEAPKISFKQAVEICRDVFYGVKNEYGEIFDNMLVGGQIDVFPKKGKRGGAFMSSDTNVPTQVLLNHTNDFSSLETLAHEMGHAIHSERTKIQTPFYEGHSITTAETASTLFENLLFDAVYEQADELSKPILLHNRITRDISTVQRQIAFFNFELEMHTTLREQGVLTHSELQTMMSKHLQSYLGPAVDIQQADGNSYVYVPHIRYGFYVYTYAFGLLMSTTIANKYKADKSYITEIDTFLSSGQSADVSSTFKKIGLHTTDPKTFTDALKNQEADIALFKKLMK